MIDYIVQLYYDSLLCLKRCKLEAIVALALFVLGLAVGASTVSKEIEVVIVSNSGIVVIEVMQNASILAVFGRMFFNSLLIATALTVLSFWQAANYCKSVIVVIIGVVTGIYIATVIMLASMLISILAVIFLVLNGLILSLAVLISFCHCQINCCDISNRDVWQVVQCNKDSYFLLILAVIAKLLLVFLIFRTLSSIF